MCVCVCVCVCVRVCQELVQTNRPLFLTCILRKVPFTLARSFIHHYSCVPHYTETFCRTALSCPHTLTLTDARYSTVCAEQHKYLQGALLSLFARPSTLWLSLASTKRTKFPHNHYKCLVTCNNFMSLTEFLKLLSTNICVDV